MVYRMWGVCRRPTVQAWQTSHSSLWDRARKGSSALHASYEQALAADVALANGQQVGAVLWDFEKFFEYLLPHILIHEAELLSFPLIDLYLGLQMHLGGRYLQVLEVVAAVVFPWQGVLHGCTLSTPFCVCLPQTLHG